MRISLVQYDIIWEDKAKNLSRLNSLLKPLQNRTDLAVLPEMFSTGFSMNSNLLAEPKDGDTIQTLQKWAKEYHFAITGSYICSENGKFYNRAFFLTPTGDSYFYDKRHLFRMGEELLHFSCGMNRCIFNYMGWNICMNICYDLRFPGWLRNINKEYDLLLIVANWPSPRISAWDILLRARAIENQSYVCGVNRIGKDGNKSEYSGHSMLVNAKGECLTDFKDNEEGIRTVEIDLSSLQLFREKFPVWKDADFFTFQGLNDSN